MSNPNEPPPTPHPDDRTQESQVSRESHARSMLKAFSWRIVATTTTTTIAFFATGEVRTALTIGSVEFFIKFFIYYLHERIWQLVPRGAVRHLFSRR